MSEATEQAILNHLALEEVHRLHGATFFEDHSWKLPANYGDVESEYEHVRVTGAGVIDMSARGRFQITGSEALMFLNGLVTNDMKALEEDRWMPAVFPNVQGRILAAVRILRNRDGFLIDTETVARSSVLKNIERFTLAGDFRVENLTDSTVMLSLQGKTAKQVMEKTFSSLDDLERNGSRVVEWHHKPLTILRATHTAEDGYDLIVSRENATALWDTLVEAGARPFGYDALEILRVEAGISRFGRDMDETNVVTETNLDEAISYTKGCYVGQEIIIRIKHRGHVAKKLTGLTLEGGVKLEAGQTIQSTSGSEAGRITSAVYSPVLGRTVALAYIRYEFLEAGTKLKVVSSEQSFVASVTELPFVRGSWY